MCLLNIISGKEEILMDEITEITDYIQEEAGLTADIIWGLGKDESLGNKINVILVATGFAAQKKVVMLENKEKADESPRQEENEGMKKFTRPVSQQQGGSQQNTDKRDIPEIPFETAVQTSVPEAPFQPRIINVRNEELKERKVIVAEPDEPTSHNDMSQKALERERRLRDLSMKMKTPEGLQDIEKEPAFMRRNVPLNKVAASDESHISRYTLFDGDGKTQIKSNNSFLHDNVD
jgi:cell division protein FtsZ